VYPEKALQIARLKKRKEIIAASFKVKHCNNNLWICQSVDQDYGSV